MIEVRALANGFYPKMPGGKPEWIDKGTKFYVSSDKLVSKEWMERLGPPAPVFQSVPAAEKPDAPAPAMDTEGRPARKSRKV